MRIIDLDVPPKKKPERLDKYLAAHIENITRSRIEQLIEVGLVEVNGKPGKKSYKVEPNDRITVRLPKPEKIEAVAQEIDLDIVYEDQDLLIVNKAPGMVVHPAHGNKDGTLVNALLHHCKDLSGINGKLRPGIVHRLDKDTSGLLLVAKSDHAHQYLSALFKSRKIQREYQALVWGHFKQSEGKIVGGIERHRNDRKKMTVSETGKPAATHYAVLAEFDLFTLLRLKLETGRTHQIRVHLSHVGHAVFGDPTYGGRNRRFAGLTANQTKYCAHLLELLPRQALHAKTLGFIHPTTHREMFFESDLAADLKTLLQHLHIRT